MKNTFISFLVGLLVGIGGHWYYAQPESKRTVADAKESVRNSASDARQSLKETFDAATIKDELTRTGRVIREKAGKTGDALADAAANAPSGNSPPSNTKSPSLPIASIWQHDDPITTVNQPCSRPLQTLVGLC